MQSKRFRGQNLYLFVGLLPAMMILFCAVVDFGRFMLLHAQADSLADSAALSAANALDLNVNRSSVGDWVLNVPLATSQAQLILDEWRFNHLQYEDWMQIRIDSVDVVDNRVHVVVIAQCQPLFLQAIGVDTFVVRVDSYSRAAVGVSNEESPH